LPATLLLSAWEPEIAPLRRWLRSAAGRRPARVVHLATVGVGAVDAGIATTALIHRLRPRCVLFVGTAGVFPGPRGVLPVAIDDAAVVSRAALVATGVLRKESYLPPPLMTEVVCDRSLVSALLHAATGATVATAACPLAITRSPVLARRITRATQATVENLELFAVGRAATLAGLPFAALVGVANRVGPRAHAEWKQHHATASAAACAAVQSWLQRR